MNKFFCAGLVMCSTLLMGCQSINTGIEKNADGSYTMTRVNVGFFRVYGSVHHCTANRNAMTCSKIDDE